MVAFHGCYVKRRRRLGFAGLSTLVLLRAAPFCSVLRRRSLGALCFCAVFWALLRRFLCCYGVFCMVAAVFVLFDNFLV